MLLDLFTKMFRRDVTKQSVWSGKELDALYAQVSGKLLESLHAAKRVKPPKVNVEKYILAQCYEEIRDLVKDLLNGRQWQFITFESFTDALQESCRTLLDEIQRPTCIVIDQLKKSSFWVFMLMLHLIRQNDETRTLFDARKHNLSLLVLYAGTRQFSLDFMKRLPDDCTFVFMDDASYSGEQVYGLVQETSDSWKLTDRSRKHLSRVSIIIPFMSKQSQLLLTKFPSTTVHQPRRIDNVFADRTLEKILGMDYFLPWNKRRYVTEYWSYLFSFLALRTFQTLTFFEHKIPDRLSLPDYWLLAGPCMVPDITHAYKVRPEKIKPLLKLLISEIDKDIERTGSTLEGREKEEAEIYYNEIFSQIEGLLQSEAFRRIYMTKVQLKTLRLEGKAWPSFCPLIDPSGCDPNYRKELKTMRKSPDEFLRHVSMQHSFFSRHLSRITPTCYVAPYKKVSLV